LPPFTALDFSRGARRRFQPGNNRANQSARHHGFHDASLKSVAKIRQDRSIIVSIQII
jgi:hypothetical protein